MCVRLRHRASHPTWHRKPKTDDKECAPIPGSRNPYHPCYLLVSCGDVVCCISLQRVCISAGFQRLITFLPFTM